MINLINLMNIPQDTIAEVTRTTDGFFLARPIGSIGFDLFLGNPNPGPGPGRDRSRSVFRSLSYSAKRTTASTAKRLGFSLRLFVGRTSTRERIMIATEGKERIVKAIAVCIALTIAGCSVSPITGPDPVSVEAIAVQAEADTIDRVYDALHEAETIEAAYDAINEAEAEADRDRVSGRTKRKERR